MVLSTGAMNFSIKGSIVHSLSFFCFPCYSPKMCIDFWMIMKGNISMEMTKRMKRRESLDLELGGN